ncbi:MAG: tRNA (adenosine(37)-N6)-threonylcarbamoyltransferase complex dimerization subunit type 1 TsaB [Acidobacteriota bacterium]|nr:tRNA (adenosine(37)-N6)-threonylcarbamoyltransferase complex dimerization subunit type 1 TsaB [Acidobacteriota bacterium]MDH3523991.1 tRNA (adenosine(37)-N6)-threonylcarbamoyltransferase complex dimerization subunit type 1 TsaB [Acidobacteriota bacterium]
MTARSGRRTVLAIDSGSPLVSVALGAGDTILARRSMAMAHSSEALLRGIDEVLREAGVALAQVGGLVALRGPGSFTGLRVGLSTLLGLHQASGIPATALPTLDVLRLAAPPAARRVACVVDALRGEWFVKLFAAGRPAAAAELRTAAGIAGLEPGWVVGHGTAALREVLPGSVELVDGPELAPLALRFAAATALEWSAATLLEPLYLRPAAARAAGR